MCENQIDGRPVLLVSEIQVVLNPISLTRYSFPYFGQIKASADTEHELFPKKEENSTLL